MTHRLQLADIVQMTSFGTFKPTGYTVLAYRDEATARRAAERLVHDDITGEDVLIASSDVVFPPVDGHMVEATRVTGAQGYEVVLMKRYLDLAARGAWWLFVRAPAGAAMEHVRRAIGDPRPLSAAHYGRLLIEDLSERPPGGPSAVDQAASAAHAR